MDAARPTHPLKELKSCIAIDTSGSTYGRTLEVELDAIQQISRLYGPNNPNLLSVLPWNHTTIDSPITLPRDSRDLRSVKSDGGTQPVSLYRNEKYFKCLQDSSVWFLFTDGQIAMSDVESFSSRTKTLGLHGTACVIVIYGRAFKPPGDEDITVGVSVYAHAPDSMLLYHDYVSNKLYILQALGCFGILLPPGQSNPPLDRTTTWHNLPQTTYGDLARVNIPSPQKLSEDELRLSDGLVVNVEELLTGNAPLAIRQKIANNIDHINTIVLSETTRGRSTNVNKWLRNEEMAVDQVETQRHDHRGAAQAAIERLYASLNNKAPNDVLEDCRSSLRYAHTTNWKEFQNINIQRENEQRYAQQNYQSAQTYSADIGPMDGSGRRRAPIKASSASKRSRQDDKIFNRTMPESKKTAVYQPRGFQSPVHVNPPFSTMVPDHNPSPNSKNCWTPNFKRESLGGGESKDYTGQCMLCHSHTHLAILVKASSSNIDLTSKIDSTSQGQKQLPSSEDSFILVNTAPDAMVVDDVAGKVQGKGKEKEKEKERAPLNITDVFSNFICCDPCAHYLVTLDSIKKSTPPPASERVVAAIPLVSMSLESNKKLWLKALEGRYDNIKELRDAVKKETDSEGFSGKNWGGFNLFPEVLLWIEEDAGMVVAKEKKAALKVNVGSRWAPSLLRNNPMWGA